MKIVEKDLTKPQSVCPSCGCVCDRRRTETRLIHSIGSKDSAKAIRLIYDVYVCKGHKRLKYFIDPGDFPVCERYDQEVADTAYELSSKYGKNTTEIRDILAEDYSVLVSLPTIRKWIESA